VCRFVVVYLNLARVYCSGESRLSEEEELLKEQTLLDLVELSDRRLNDLNSKRGTMYLSHMPEEEKTREKEKEETKKKPTYKPYSLKDYKGLPKVFELGTLGPELDSEFLAEKRAKKEREAKFGLEASKLNRTHIMAQKMK
jgi:hypothetical protein